MKRKLTVILVVISILASVLLFTACSGDEPAKDITSLDKAKLSGNGEDIYNRLENMAINFKDRTFGDEGERRFSEYLIEELTGLGYKNESKTFEYKNELSDKATIPLTSTNVIFKKDAVDTDKTVIITSQIDNLFKYENYNDEGIYNGLAGVAIMMELANDLKDVTLPFDVYFVGFGANQLSWKGAQEFYSEFYVHHAKKDTLLMVDLSRPIGGDHMYMYTDEVDTIHAEYLDSVAKESALDFRPIPRDKQVVDAILLENQPMAYSHVGVLSSNILFLTARIPSVNFLSVNWEARVIGDTVERLGHANIANTKRDNWDYFLELVGKERIVGESDMVYTTIMNALNAPDFMATMDESIANMPDYSVWSSTGLQLGLRLGIAITLIVVAVLVSSKIRKKLPQRPMDEFMQELGATRMNMYNMNNTNNNNPFDNNANNSSNSGSDPFSEVENEFEKKDKNDDNKGDGDDIFGI